MSRSQIATIAAYTFLEAARNRLAWLAVAFVLVGFALAEFVGDLAITESATFESGFLGAFLRFCAVFMAALFVITSMVREFDDKVLELVLALPVPRAHYYFGKLLGFSLLAALTAVVFGLVLLIYVPADQVALWVISLTCELLIVTALSLLCLYLLARTIDAFRLMAEHPVAVAETLSHQVIQWVIEGLAFLLPSFERFTSSAWLVYHGGAWADLLPIAAQTLIYLVLLAGAALFDLYRKNL